MSPPWLVQFAADRIQPAIPVSEDNWKIICPSPSSVSFFYPIHLPPLLNYFSVFTYVSAFHTSDPANICRQLQSTSTHSLLPIWCLWCKSRDRQWTRWGNHFNRSQGARQYLYNSPWTHHCCWYVPLHCRVLVCLGKCTLYSSIIRMTWESSLVFSAVMWVFNRHFSNTMGNVGF